MKLCQKQFSIATELIYKDWLIKTAFNQSGIEIKSQEKTDITTHLGLFQFQTILFDLWNAPFHFERYIVETWFDYVNRFLYMLMRSQVLKSHFEHLNLLFQTLQATSFDIKISNDQFFMKEVGFFGHHVIIIFTIFQN